MITPEQQLAILAAIWGTGKQDDDGWVFLPWIDGTARTKEQRRKSYREGPAFKWPEQRAAILDHLRTHQDDDQYYCPTVFNKPQRIAKYANPEKALWADLDDDYSEDCLAEFPPSIRYRTSDDHEQAVWLMKKPRVGASWRGEANHRLTAWLGADPSGWDTTQLLRVPSWENHKYDPPQQGKLTYARTKIRYGWADVDELLADVEVPTTEGDGIIDDELINGLDHDELWAEVRRKHHAKRKLNKLSKLKRSGSDDSDRSDRVWEMARLLDELSHTPAEAFVIIEPTVWAADRTFKRLKQDITNAYAKGAAEPADDNGPDLVLPDVTFWGQDKVLGRVRRHAHSRGVSADVVLYAVLTRLSAMLYPECRLVTGIGSELGASLNLFAAVAGPPGSKKTSSAGVAKSVLDDSVGLDDLPLGTGEGLAEHFMGEEIEETDEINMSGPRKGQPKLRKVRRQTKHNLFVVTDEGEVFKKLKDKTGSILGENLRSMWLGVGFGNLNANQERNRYIAEGTYSVGMLIGFQLGTIQPLLGAADTGEPQRFCYVWANDPNIPDERPDEYRSEKISPLLQREKMTLPEGIRQQLWEHHRARDKGLLKVSEWDVHGLLTQAKLAGLLALLLRKSLEVNEKDWKLAGVMWETSCRVRDYLIEHGHGLASSKRATENQYHVERAELVEMAKSGIPQKVDRVARLLAKYVRDPEKTTGRVKDAENRLDSKARPFFHTALDYAVELDWITRNGDDISPGQTDP